MEGVPGRVKGLGAKPWRRLDTAGGEEGALRLAAQQEDDEGTWGTE